MFPKPRVKQYLTEHTDPDQIDADFPPDVLAGDGSMVGYYEILPYAKPIEFTLGAQTWLLDDQHCVRAKCSCQEAALSFFELRHSCPTQRYCQRADSLHPLCVRYSTNRTAFRGKGWTVVRAGFRRCAKRSPTGFRSRLGQAPSLLASIVSPRPKPEDNPVAGTQTWSKPALFLWQRQKVQKSVAVLDVKIVAARCPIPRTMNLNCIHCSIAPQKGQFHECARYSPIIQRA